MIGSQEANLKASASVTSINFPLAKVNYVAKLKYNIVLKCPSPSTAYHEKHAL